MSEYMKLYRKYEADCHKADKIKDPKRREAAFAKCQKQFARLQARSDRPKEMPPATKNEQLLADVFLSGGPITGPDPVLELPKIETLTELQKYVRTTDRGDVFPSVLVSLQGAAGKLGISLELPTLPRDVDVFIWRVKHEHQTDLDRWKATVGNAFAAIIAETRTAQTASVPISKLLSISEAARRLNKNRSTITRWIQDGLLPASKTPSGLPGIREEDLKIVRDK